MCGLGAHGKVSVHFCSSGAPESAAHFNLTASLAAAQPQAHDAHATGNSGNAYGYLARPVRKVRRNAVLGDITNTAPNFGAGRRLGVLQTCDLPTREPKV